MEDRITTLIDGKLFALGGTVQLDGRISWYPTEARGFAPNHSYLLVEEGSAVLIDSGLPVHRQTVLDQLRSLLEPGMQLSILHTRIVEYDSVGNTTAICATFPTERLYGHFPAGLLTGFSPLDQGLDPGGPEEIVPRIGDSLRVDGGRELILLGAPLRLLLTFWVYDVETGTLFTSDSFGHAYLEDPSSPHVISGIDGWADREQVRRHLLAKFEWLSGADRRPLAAELAELFESHEIETIAPMHGCVLRGADTVARHRDLMYKALEAG